MSDETLHPLGRWSVIDIETTGIDFLSDSIIDVGFLEFEGTKLVRKYSSLVQYEGRLSKFIEKLTGITSKMLKKAPSFKEVEGEIQELYGQCLIAHNADFERNFLINSFDKISDQSGREEYVDSIPFLAAVFPFVTSVKLENFIIDWEIADHEIHRGYEDSLDLLKVMLLTMAYLHTDQEWLTRVKVLMQRHHLKDYWFFDFINLSKDEITDIATQIDFNLDNHIDVVKNWVQANREVEKIEQQSLDCFDHSFSGTNVSTILKAEDKIQDILPGYKFRKSQEELSLKTGQAFKNGIHALVQAPTGTGKTLGYLLPSALFSVAEKKQVLVATGTKALQHQAMSKDVPQIRKVLGLGPGELRVAELVGSKNHMCELLYRQSVDDGSLMEMGEDFDSRFANLYFDMVFTHNELYEKRLKKLDIPYVLKMKNKSFKTLDQDITVDYKSCAGSKCPYKGNCTYINGLQEAKDAHIVVTNHSMMFQWTKAFPRPAYIVVDEAHRLEHEATNSHQYEVNRYDLESLSRNILHMQGIGSLFYLLAQHEQTEGASSPVIKAIRDDVLIFQKKLDEELEPLNDDVEEHFKKMPRYTSLYWNELPMIGRNDKRDELSVHLRNTFERLRVILMDIEKLLLPHTIQFELKAFNDDSNIMAFAKVENFMSHLAELIQAFSSCLNFDDNGEEVKESEGNFARSFKFHENEGYQLLASPVDVGKILHDSLLQTSNSVVFTSATLGNAHGDQGTKGIEWATGYLYLEPEKRFKSGFYLPSVYDYKNKSKVFICSDAPPIYDSSFVDKTFGHVLKLIKELEGRSLLLFSAKARFEMAREYLLENLNGEIPLFIQGMGNNIIDEFKRSGNGILLGMESFSEGIDIPGDALNFVFIDKIPDLRMDLVVNKRRDFYQANIGNEFTDYYLAHRTRSLHQKLGRLLRTEKDFGGVIIVDSRIKKWKGKTLHTLESLMQPYELNFATLPEACSEVKDFILNPRLEV